MYGEVRERITSRARRRSGLILLAAFVCFAAFLGAPWTARAEDQPIQHLASTYVNTMFTGATDYATPGQKFTTSTGPGTATALSLPGSAGTLWILDALLKDAYLLALRIVQGLALGPNSTVSTSV